MHRLVLLALLALMFTPAVVRAAPQEDEKAAEEKILKDWDGFADFVRTTRRELAALQLSFNGSEQSEQKAGLETAYNQKRDGAKARSTAFWAEVEGFLTKFPKNQKVRERRLADTTFDRVSSAVRAKDADTLFELTGNGEFLHKSAKAYEKSYRYDLAADRWANAAEKAKTFQVLHDLGAACMNCYRFADAKKAFQASFELATSQKDKQEAERLIESAQNYVGWWEKEQELRKKAEASKDLPLVEITTDRGRMLIELFEDEAPNTVANFIELVEKGFYNNLGFHRCLAYFMIQGGDPMGNGQGGPGYKIKDEYALPNARRHFPGTLSMANVGQPDTNGSQFFVTSTTTTWLNGRHTVFGRVLEGIEVPQVLAIDPADPNNKAAPFVLREAKVIRKRDHPYVAEKIMGAEPKR